MVNNIIESGSHGFYRPKLSIPLIWRSQSTGLSLFWWNTSPSTIPMKHQLSNPRPTFVCGSQYVYWINNCANWKVRRIVCVFMWLERQLKPMFESVYILLINYNKSKRTNRFNQDARCRRNVICVCIDIRCKTACKWSSGFKRGRSQSPPKCIQYVICF